MLKTPLQTGAMMSELIASNSGISMIPVPAMPAMTEKIHIWLIEDSEADELLMRQALELEGMDCNFHLSMDGEAAVDLLESMERGDDWPQPHIILLDLNLPRKGGARVLESIRKSTVCGDTPVVVVTSSDSPSDKNCVARLGASHYFQKPLDLEEFMKLGSVVRQVLTGSKARN